MSNTEITSLLQNTVTTTDLAATLSYLENLQADIFKIKTDGSPSPISSDEVASAITELKSRPVITLQIASLLSPRGLSQVATYLQQTITKPVVINQEIDCRLIGGAKILWQGRILDKSLYQRLKTS
ncbi:MAG: F0F1 ATP synthase subunit delta [candidate division WWE3 bacterium]|nr:F0F1 ATP synthase subunit delta [candidate division WWE3 bacterium]